MDIEERDFVQFLVIRKKLSTSSVRTYANRFGVIKRWLFNNSRQLSKQAIEDFLYSKKQEHLSNAALNTYIQCLNHLDSFCKDRNLPSGFMEGIDALPKRQPEIIILSLDEIDRLLSTKLTYKNRNGVDCTELDEKYLTLTAFLAITGCRFEEAASLQAKRLDIDDGRATLIDTKNKHNRFIYFDGPVKDSLRKLSAKLSPDDLVFTNSKNQHMHPGDFNDNLSLRAKTAGITKRVHAHLLRHSFATHLLEAGVDITMVASLLGHRDIQTTYDTYVHLADKTLQKASQKHPLLRQYTEPAILLQDIKASIEKFNIQNDNRFTFNLMQNNSGLEVNIQII